MKIERVRQTSATVITLPNDIEVLYSYSTPVACYFPASGTTWRTSERYSVTTSRQVNAWCKDYPEAVEVEQGWINGVAEGLCTGPVTGAA
jgi:hypothetical protein